MGPVRLVTLDVTNTLLKVKGGVGGMYTYIADQLNIDSLSQVPVDKINSSFKESFKQHWGATPNFGYGEMTVRTI